MAKPKAFRKKGSIRRRAIRIHALDDALHAASVANELGVPVLLISAAGAAATIGPAWFQGIVGHIERKYPKLHLQAVLDCGDAAGYALAALRSGVKFIRFSGNRAVAGKIADIARQQGAQLVVDPLDILDLRGKSDADTAIGGWLADK